MSTTRKRPSTTRKTISTTSRKKKYKPATNLLWWRFAALVLVLILLSPFYYGYVLKTFSSTWRWIIDAGESPSYRTYKSFNIRIPTGYKKHGIDVSYAQGKINWHKVAAMNEDSIRISFAFIKATEGLLTVDPYFKRNWREAPKAGIVCGAYHFLRPAKSGAWQARFFMQNVKME
ncbi:glycoside hydrolase family 25 protein, partial [Mucilaginibacter sp.]|uniref:glycoside hydrolase family 25 protein n=1 Tax=Mucilaginibacter sp. TaxID=1882438 RepID=UPI0035BBA4A2